MHRQYMKYRGSPSRMKCPRLSSVYFCLSRGCCAVGCFARPHKLIGADASVINSFLLFGLSRLNCSLPGVENETAFQEDKQSICPNKINQALFLLVHAHRTFRFKFHALHPDIF